MLAQFDEQKDKPSGLLSRLTSKVQTYVGNKVINEQDLDDLIEPLAQ